MNDNGAPIDPQAGPAAMQCFDTFLRIQNTKDLVAMSEHLLRSDDTAWVTGGTTVLGHAGIVAGLAQFYKGTWGIDPAKVRDFSLVLGTADALQLYANAELHIGKAGEEPRDVRYHLNLSYLRTERGWRLAALIPMRVV